MQSPLTTPTTNRIKKMNTKSSSGKKMKQSSLMSFFGKGTTVSSNSKANKNANTEKDITASPTPKRKNKNSLFVEDEGDDDSKDIELIEGKDVETASILKVDNTTSQNISNKPISNTSPISTNKKEISNSSSSNTISSSITTPTKSSNDKHKTSIQNNLDDDDEDESLLNISRRSKRNISYAEDSDEDESLFKLNKKARSKAIADDSDEEDEYKPSKKQVSDDSDFDDDILELAGSSSPTPTSSLSNSAKQDNSLKMKKKLNDLITGKSTPIAKKKISSILPSKSSPAKHSKFKKENEERYQWLVDIKDAQGHKETDPDYDPRTLHIPNSAWNKFTPFEKQYWGIKSKMWDCIVFFKKGKFFELYEKDAALANNLFDWKIVGGGRANMQLAGIPEMSFDYWTAQFIQHGYKVAKVDQCESMLAKEMREGSKGIVRRELQYILTSGTLTDNEMIQSDLASYCLAIIEEPANYYGEEENDDIKRIFGISFIDTSTGEIELLEFSDNDECSNLDTIMSQVRPKEVIMIKNNLSNLAQKIVKFNSASNALFNYVKPEEEFYTFEKTYEEIIGSEPPYFESEDKWPSVLKDYYTSNKIIGFSAFGGLLHYLQWLKLDQSLVSMGNMREYNPVKSQNSLILDGITLQNLEIFSNSFDGSDKGTLYKLVNQGVTPMGKRKMRKWLMHPLYNISDIEKRQDSVEFLLSNIEIRDIFESRMTNLPDLERLLSRIHSGNLKMKLFDKVIQGFETIVDLLKKLSNKELKGCLKTFLSHIPESFFEDVENWTNAFDRRKAAEEDIIEPHPGVEPEFDESLANINAIESELMSILSEYQKRFKNSNIKFKDSGKEIYTIEVPVSLTKQIPSSWVQMGANKTTRRYYSDEVRKLARTMAEAKETHKLIEESLKERLCKKFDSQYVSTWMPVINTISNIDCILALARISESLGFPACRPKFVEHVDEETGENKNGYLKFISLRHPCFNIGSSTHKEFIPNDVILGKDEPQLGLLTGANAAGKSTVLRMTCVAVILAQIGCWVPCESAELTPVDRIMTRLGASDNIMQGKSTFFVELSETKRILDMATNRSLLVVDELGRGGSSTDGFAIAESVLYHVATHIQSLGFFATHYGSLGASFTGHPQVKQMRMQILVDEATRQVTFLYKLTEGKSEGSFGMHVASMCGILKEIVDNAEIAAQNLEHTSKLLRTMKTGNDDGMGKNKPIQSGLQSDFVRLVYGDGLKNTELGTGEGVKFYSNHIKANALKDLFAMIDAYDD